MALPEPRIRPNQPVPTALFPPPLQELLEAQRAMPQRPMTEWAGLPVMLPRQKGLVLTQRKVPQPAFEETPQVPASEVA